MSLLTFFFVFFLSRMFQKWQQTIQKNNKLVSSITTDDEIKGPNDEKKTQVAIQKLADETANQYLQRLCFFLNHYEQYGKPQALAYSLIWRNMYVLFWQKKRIYTHCFSFCLFITTANS